MGAPVEADRLPAALADTPIQAVDTTSNDNATALTFPELRGFLPPGFLAENAFSFTVASIGSGAATWGVVSACFGTGAHYNNVWLVVTGVIAAIAGLTWGARRTATQTMLGTFGIIQAIAAFWLYLGSFDPTWQTYATGDRMAAIAAGLEITTLGLIALLGNQRHVVFLLVVSWIWGNLWILYFIFAPVSSQIDVVIIDRTIEGGPAASSTFVVDGLIFLCICHVLERNPLRLCQG